MLWPVAELRLRQGDILVAEVKVLNSTDCDCLVVAEVEGVGRRARVDVNLGYIKERAIREADRVIAAAANDRIVAAMRLNVEVIVAASTLQRRISTRSATKEPELIVARPALQNIALRANQCIVPAPPESVLCPNTGIGVLEDTSFRHCTMPVRTAIP